MSEQLAQDTALTAVCIVCAWLLPSGNEQLWASPRVPTWRASFTFLAAITWAALWAIGVTGDQEVLPLVAVYPGLGILALALGYVGRTRGSRVTLAEYLLLTLMVCCQLGLLALGRARSLPAEALQFIQ